MIQNNWLVRKAPALEATKSRDGKNRSLVVTDEMVAAGIEALLSSFSEEWISWRAPGLARGVTQVYLAMAAFAAGANG
jgi:hypothetical protein